MIELFDEFRDLLVELHLAGARFVVPPRRIDIINRADGITFAEAVAEGETFRVDGCKIPVIGREALRKNKRAAGRDQVIADVKALGAKR